MVLVLGSGSPRRKQILESLGCTFTIIPPEVDESRLDNELPESYILRVLRDKTGYVLKETESDSDRVIITSDTIVTIDGIILGKPLSRDDAVSMLSRLSGRTHRVITGISIASVNNGVPVIHTGLEHTDVTFRQLDGAAISNYLDVTEYMDKAGSYAVQENGEMILESVQGSVTNVIGFPLRLFYSMLGHAGLYNILA